MWGLLCPCLATTRRNVKAVGDDLPLHEFPPLREDYMSGKYNPEEDPTVLAGRAEKEARRIAIEKGVERSEWLNLWRTYERCVEIAELVWGSRLKGDAAAQQALAETMRDRKAIFTMDGGECATVGFEIPVPLFTPRDRAQLIKEAAATLLISADRRGLSVRYPKERPDAPEETQAPPEPGIEAASGASEGEMEPETPGFTSSGAP
jgi:hypothetical protein